MMTCMRMLSTVRLVTSAYRFCGADGSAKHLEQLVDLFILIDDLVVVLGLLPYVAAVRLPFTSRNQVTSRYFGWRVAS